MELAFFRLAITFFVELSAETAIDGTCPARRYSAAIEFSLLDLIDE